MSDEVVCLAVDADIGGIGVRVSFYIQSFVLVFLIACSDSFKDASGALWTLIATSIGLQIAAVIQYGTSSGALTLYQAIQVSNLAWMANFCIVIGLASYSRGRRTLEHDFLVQIGAMVEMYLSIILSLALWIVAPSFKGDTCVDKTPFIFFWKSFPAIKSGRWINCTFIVIIGVSYTYLTYTELATRWRKRRNKTKEKSDVVSLAESGGRNGAPSIANTNVEVPTTPVQSVAHWRNRHDNRRVGLGDGISHESSIHPTHSSEGDTSQRGASSRSGKMRTAKRKGRKRNWQWSHLPPILFSIAFFEVAVTAYFVAMNELLVSKGAPDSGPSQWSFGQVLALIVLFPSVVTLWQSIRERHWGPAKEEPPTEASRVPVTTHFSLRGLKRGASDS